jgi:tRNA threonylcarbamoyladenosine biosynthesis protein TsaE
MTEITIQTNSVEETQTLAAAIAKQLPRPTILALFGHLGAGKTHFIKGVGMGLGLDPRKICSATFVLIAEYGDNSELTHIDAYRIDDPEELIDIGFNELIENPNSLIAIEWSEKIREILPPNRLEIEIKIINDTSRTITLRPIDQATTTALNIALNK